MDSTPKRRLKVTVNGRPYLVEVGDLLASPISVKVNGQPYQVDIETSEVSKVPAGESMAALETVARQPVAPPTPAGQTDANTKEVTAPMPGHISSIAVKAGDEVSVGQELCALEAMKMQNAIRSPRAGVIASVTVVSGQAVGHGDVLATFL